MNICKFVRTREHAKYFFYPPLPSQSNKKLRPYPAMAFQINSFAVILYTAKSPRFRNCFARTLEE